MSKKESKRKKATVMKRKRGSEKEEKVSYEYLHNLSLPFSPLESYTLSSFPSSGGPPPHHILRSSSRSHPPNAKGVFAGASVASHLEANCEFFLLTHRMITMYHHHPCISTRGIVRPSVRPSGLGGSDLGPSRWLVRP